MTVEELVARKRKLEDDIAAAVTKFANEFTDETGISPESINIHVMETTSISDARRRYRVTGAEVRIEI